MPADPADSKTGKPQVTFKWDDAATWLALQGLATGAGFRSVNLFARHLCEEAVRRGPSGQPTSQAGDAGAGSPAVVIESRLATVTAALDGLRGDVQQLRQPDSDSAAAAAKMHKSVRSLHETVKAELVQLRGDAAQQLDQAAGELHSLRCNLADAFALLIVKLDTKVTTKDAKKWVNKNFFNVESEE